MIWEKSYRQFEAMPPIFVILNCKLYPMKKNASLFLLASILIAACGSPEAPAEEPKQNIKEEAVAYNLDSVNMNGFVAYDESIEGERPVVMIVHEWWGLNDYAKSRAKQLAGMGYLVMAVDLYGDGITAEDPETASKLSKPFYENPVMAKSHFDAALEKIKTYPQADTNRIAALGYCFGGGMVLNFARMGGDFKGVVSFHGNLLGVAPKKELLKADILVCHGEDDKFVSAPEVKAFKRELDEITAAYTVRTYAGATHAFSNPAATEKGKKYDIPVAYNAAADTASFKEMELFLEKVFKI